MRVSEIRVSSSALSVFSYDIRNTQLNFHLLVIDVVVGRMVCVVQL